MYIKVKSFGDFLVSRPEGRDAALVLRHQFLDKHQATSLELDFEGVNLLTPSWIDEFLQEAVKTIPKNKITFVNSEQNSSVQLSLETVMPTL